MIGAFDTSDLKNVSTFDGKINYRLRAKKPPAVINFSNKDIFDVLEKSRQAEVSNKEPKSERANCSLFRILLLSKS